MTFEQDLKEMMEGTLQMPEETTFKTEGTASARNVSGTLPAVRGEKEECRGRGLQHSNACGRCNQEMTGVYS